MTPRVVLLRGTAANPWDLQAWEALHAAGDAHVTVVVPPDNQYDVSAVRLPRVQVETVGGKLPGGPAGAFALKAVGQRHLGLADALAGADIVHAAELGNWFTAQAAREKARLGFRLAVTVWETLPFVDAYRNVRTRRHRRAVLGGADLFLPVTARARDALRLEGVAADRMEIVPPGIDVARFAAAREARPPADGRHLILSVGRMVWEKGHQDLLRAVALLRAQGRDDLRVLLVGAGPERKRIEGVRADLRLDGVVELRESVPYGEMPGVYAAASCLVLASIPTPFWEEQFGMVLAEALAGHVPIVAAASGAIPEVLDGQGTLFAPGDWVGLADALAAGPLAKVPAARPAPDDELVERYSVDAAAARLREVYARLA